MQRPATRSALSHLSPPKSHHHFDHCRIPQRGVVKDHSRFQPAIGLERLNAPVRITASPTLLLMRKLCKCNSCISHLVGARSSHPQTRFGPRGSSHYSDYFDLIESKYRIQILPACAVPCRPRLLVSSSSASSDRHGHGIAIRPLARAALRAQLDRARFLETLISDCIYLGRAVAKARKVHFPHRLRAVHRHTPTDLVELRGVARRKRLPHRH